MPSDSRQPHRGRFSDGQTAATVAAEVHLKPTGVEILPEGGLAPLLWPYAGLSTAAPLAKSDGDVLLRHLTTPGATLFVADGQFIAGLADRASHLKAGAQRWRMAWPLLILGTVVLLTAGGLWLADVRLAQGLARLVPTAVRQSLGQQVVASLSQGGAPACHSGEGRAALDRLTERLAAAAGGKRFTVNVLSWNLLNAFAVPGEQIILTRALIEQAKTPDEVAGVLAHEMGHGLALHPESGIIRALALGAAVDLMLGNRGTLANLAVLLVQLGYSREAEREADLHAVQILKAAGISPKGFGDFFETIEGKSGRRKGAKAGAGKGLLSFMDTHPLTQDRIAMVRAQPPYPATPALTDGDWQALRQICGGPRPAAPAKPEAAPPGAPGTEAQPAPKIDEQRSP